MSIWLDVTSHLCPNQFYWIECTVGHRKLNYFMICCCHFIYNVFGCDMYLLYDHEELWVQGIIWKRYSIMNQPFNHFWFCPTFCWHFFRSSWMIWGIIHDNKTSRGRFGSSLFLNHSSKCYPVISSWWWPKVFLEWKMKVVLVIQPKVVTKDWILTAEMSMTHLNHQYYVVSI